ncbi:hypothetical protein IE4872_PD00727 (plasmid) [Rhizobium gallicum]|uniref:Uncharacterized protein n=1 Tax=Rhizobium gallicum TaxID=56730 RepID=A0A1L5NTN0_9HYPH|nr:hypothetical protein IE4872_PD00727 [Rhizobium gallicum]
MTSATILDLAIALTARRRIIRPAFGEIDVGPQRPHLFADDSPQKACRSPSG